jgi:hypothetical protein
MASRGWFLGFVLRISDGYPQQISYKSAFLPLPTTAIHGMKYKHLHLSSRRSEPFHNLSPLGT